MRYRWHDAKLSAVVCWNLVIKTDRVFLFSIVFVGVLFILQWLFAIDQLFQILFADNGLSFFERIGFLLDGFLNIFRYVDDVVPVALIVIAFLQAASITLLVSFTGSKKSLQRQAGPLTIALIGVGCVACGGSLFTPVLSLIATNISLAFAQSLSKLLLLVAVILSYIALNETSYRVAKRV